MTNKRNNKEEGKKNSYPVLILFDLMSYAGWSLRKRLRRDRLTLSGVAVACNGRLCAAIFWTDFVCFKFEWTDVVLTISERCCCAANNAAIDDVDDDVERL